MSRFFFRWRGHSQWRLSRCAQFLPEKRAWFHKMPCRGTWPCWTCTRLETQIWVLEDAMPRRKICMYIYIYVRPGCEFLLERRFKQRVVLTTQLELYPRINIFCVLSHYYHINKIGAFHRRRHARKPPNRPTASVQIELLPKSNIQGPNSTANWCCQRSFNTNQMLPECFKSFRREPLSILSKRLLSGEDFLPNDLFLASVGLLHCSVKHFLWRAPNIRPCTIALNVGNDGLQEEGGIDNSIYFQSQSYAYTRLSCPRFLEVVGTKTHLIWNNQSSIGTDGAWRSLTSACHWAMEESIRS